MVTQPGKSCQSDPFPNKNTVDWLIQLIWLKHSLIWSFWQTNWLEMANVG